MKKILSTLFVLVALLAMTTGAAFAGSALELVEVRNDEGVPTFVFRVTGEFSQEELENGFVKVGGEDFPLYCAQQDEDTVVCHTSKAAAGNEVVVGFGGASFWDRVPEQGPGQQQYCYNIYDWNDVGSSATAWFAWGVNCQDEPANIGDSIYFDTPLFFPEDYFFFPNTGGACGWADPGEGYYYTGCPSSPL